MADSRADDQSGPISDTDEEEVGYGNPPKHSRFRPGKSGNPGGSSRKARARSVPTLRAELAELILEEAVMPTTYRENGKLVTKTRIAAVYARTMAGGLMGNASAAKVALVFATAAQQDREKAQRDHIEMLGRMWRVQQAKLEEAHIRGDQNPELYPHPDDIYVNANGEPVCDGPLDKRTHDAMLAIKKQYDWLCGLHSECADQKKRARLLKDIRRLEKGLPRRWLGVE